VTVPDGNTIALWASAIATIIVLVRQQLNAMAGKRRGEEDSKKIQDIHSTTLNGQFQILETRAIALRALATLRQTPLDIKAAERAER